ncbi:lysophospholipid acyltransferase family protein [Candidatus Legionella polyplacis]|uniref:Lysophospholipid acyltransferase family protein n=1 Tax=Candidatus Legionella polyplacis TaxID=2005262 RepID=A0ABZ2GX64_9GAMM
MYKKKNILKKINSIKIIIISLYYTILACCQSIIRKKLNIINRNYTDKIIQLWSKRLIKTAKIRYKIFNPKNIKPKLNEPTILMSNHRSLYDIPIIFRIFPTYSIRMLTKKELIKIPFFGKGILLSEFPVIDRKNKYQAIKDLEYMNNLIKKGIIIWASPEGTRSKNKKLMPFKKGVFISAIKTKSTIIPIGLKGTDNILPKKTTQININQEVEIHIGEPIYSNIYNLKNKEKLILKTFKSIEKLIN